MEAEKNAPDGENDIYGVISQTFLFRGAQESIIKTALSGEGFHTARYASGDIIYEPARFERSLGIIISGAAKITTSDGGKRVTLRQIKKGEVFGSASLFGGGDEYVTTITVKGPTQAAFFTQQAITELLTSDSRISLNYIEFLSDRVRFLNRKIAAFTSKSAASRLAHYLCGLPRSGDEISLPLGLKPLSDSLDLGRASLYRAFSELEAEGCIKREGRKVIILSEELLKNSS